MPGRKYAAGGLYRYGFNGKENDNEVDGEGGQQDYGMRIYDPRIGRFLGVDPLMRRYPWYTPYQFAGDNPIKFIDLDGLEPAEKGTSLSDKVMSTDKNGVSHYWQWNGSAWQDANVGQDIEIRTKARSAHGIMHMSQYERGGVEGMFVPTGGMIVPSPTGQVGPYTMIPVQRGSQIDVFIARRFTGGINVSNDGDIYDEYHDEWAVSFDMLPKFRDNVTLYSNLGIYVNVYSNDRVYPTFWEGMKAGWTPENIMYGLVGMGH